jgi:hypothetical protein
MEHAAGNGSRIEYGYRVPQQGKIMRGGKPSRASADDCYFPLLSDPGLFREHVERIA